MAEPPPTRGIPDDFVRPDAAAAQRLRRPEPAAAPVAGGSSYVALDFETATRHRSSACALGIVTVADGEIVERVSWLIRPPGDRYDAGNVRVHGIRPQDTRGQPRLPELWARVEPYLERRLLVAHNAGFDVGVLKASLAHYGIAPPRAEYACTCTIARRTWPGRPSYGLKPISSFLGTRFRHHDALEDADACARIAIRSAELAGTACLRTMCRGRKVKVHTLEPETPALSGRRR